MSSTFQFKQFTIQQNYAAMKVGTDSVLLGSWTSVKEGNALDIGSGTGLIALMLAQRTETMLIDAVEIDVGAYTQTIGNIKNSNWSDRIAMHNNSIQNYQPNKQYDIIVTNPPFFIDSTRAANSEKNTARHTDELPFDDLIHAVKRLLKPDGIFSLILPITESKVFIELAEASSIYLNKVCIVYPNSNKPAKRKMMEFSFLKTTILKEKLTIETETRHQYTKEYISLTKDFYLKF